MTTIPIPRRKKVKAKKNKLNKSVRPIEEIRKDGDYICGFRRMPGTYNRNDRWND
jgi:hypothetical protein